MANSIYGKADSTLVNMAYRAAMANVPLDQTAIFAAREENLRNFTTAVSGLMQPEWDGYLDAEKRRLELAQECRDIINTGGNTNEIHIGQHHDYIHRMKNDLEAIKADRTMSSYEKDRAEHLLNLNMTKYKAALDHEGELIPKLVGNSADDNIYTDTDSPQARMFNGLLEDYNNKTNFMTRSIEGGEIMYTDPDGNTMSLRDIEKGLTVRDAGYQTKIQSSLNKMYEQSLDIVRGNGVISPSDKFRMKRTLIDNMTDEHQIRNLSHGIYNNNNHNFEQILLGQAKTSGLNDHQLIDSSGIELIYNELDRLGTRHGGTSVIDMNDDGKYNEQDTKDYRDPNNAAILIKKIKEDKSLWKELLAGYTVESTLKPIDALAEMERITSVENQVKKEAAEMLEKNPPKKGETKYEYESRTTGIKTGIAPDNRVWDGTKFVEKKGDDPVSTTLKTITW